MMEQKEQNSQKKVLVVDDSLFMRRLITDMLNSDPQIEVIDTAKGGADALEKISKKKNRLHYFRSSYAG